MLEYSLLYDISEVSSEATGFLFKYFELILRMANLQDYFDICSF